MNLLLINGPNLNLLGEREPHIYGATTLNDIEQRLTLLAEQHQVKLEHFQSNAEHELINKVQAARGKVDAILINPAAYTHTSVALRDALIAADIPFYEVHLSNVYRRESFRHHSYFSDIASGVFVGLGPLGYELALTAAVVKHNESKLS